MPVFISYSHQDKDFVEELAIELVRHKVHVWIDTWEINVGDSLVDRIQEAIESSSALLVVLSKASVASEWCKKELNSGLIRELEEKRVVVLPVLIEDCDLPLFLREKYYADFRSGRDEGLNKILSAIASVTSVNRGRIETPDFYDDWSVDIGMAEDQLRMSITVVSHSESLPYCVLTTFACICNEYTSGRYAPVLQAGMGWFVEWFLVEILYELVKDSSDDEYSFILGDANAQSRLIELQDSTSSLNTACVVTSRWLGTDTGKDVRIDYGGQIINIRNSLSNVIREPTEKEQATLRRLLGGPPSVINPTSRPSNKKVIKKNKRKRKR